MNINGYPEIEDLSQGDKLVVETTDGTRKIDGKNVIKVADPITLDPVVLHRNTYRGKNLGSTFTEEQKQAISDGTFDDLYLGDYWSIDGRNYRIADINHFPLISKNHLCIISDDPLGSCKSNESGTSYDTFLNSTLYKTLETTILNIVKNAFGEDNLNDIKAYNFGGFDKSTGLPVSVSYYESKLRLPTSSELFGFPISSRVMWSSKYVVGDGSNHLNGSYNQLAIFKEDPDYIQHNAHLWANKSSWIGDSVFVNTSTSNFNQWAYMFDPGEKFIGLSTASLTWEFSVRPIFALS